jgi:hypothetical protein
MTRFEKALKDVNDWMESYTDDGNQVLSDHGPTIMEALEKAGRCLEAAKVPEQPVSSSLVKKLEAHKKAAPAPELYVDGWECAFQCAINIVREHERESSSLSSDYLEQMQAHVDEGGTLSHQNGIELLTELRRRG